MKRPVKLVTVLLAHLCWTLRKRGLPAAVEKILDVFHTLEDSIERFMCVLHSNEHKNIRNETSLLRALLTDAPGCSTSA